MAGEIGKTQQEKREIAERRRSQRTQIRATRANQEDQQAFQNARDRIARDTSLSKDQAARKFARWKVRYQERKQDARSSSSGGGRGGGGGGGAGSGTTKNDAATRDQLKNFQTNFRRALNVASAIRGQNSRSTVARILTDGQKATKEEPGVNAVGDQLAISMALDMAYDGHISRANARTIKKQRGITVGGVQGAKSYEDWKRSRRTISRPSNARGVGGRRPT